MIGEKAACLHDATSAFYHKDNLDRQSGKQGNTRMYGATSNRI